MGAKDCGRSREAHHRPSATRVESTRSAGFASKKRWREYPRMRKAILIALGAAAACRDPRAEANIAQAMTEVGTTINSMQQDYAILQHQLDSLRQVVARQDTVIGRLAGMAGLPYSPR
jgi:hypothetical protein